MKRRKYFVFAILYGILFLMAGTASAEEYAFDGSADGFTSLYDGMPPELQSEFGEIDLSNPEQTTRELTEKLNLGYWIRQILRVLGDALVPSIKTGSIILGMLIVTVLMDQMTKNLTGSSIGHIFGLCTDLCMAAVILSAAESLIQMASEYLTRLCTIMNVMIPVTEAIYLSEASVSRLAVHRSAMLLYIGITSNMNNLIIRPLFGILFGFAIVGSVFGRCGLSGFVGGIRKFAMLIISVFTMLFSFILGLQTVLAGCADSLGMKTIRLLIGNFIPIIGGTLSEALSTVKEGMNVIRSITGVWGIIIILMLVLPVTVHLFCSNAILSFCHMSAEILGAGKSAAFLDEIKSVLSILCALVYAATLLFVMALIIFAKIGGGA